MILLVAGKRPRAICRECLALHRPENCPKAKSKRRRERQDRKAWFAEMIAYRDRLMSRKVGSA